MAFHKCKAKMYCLFQEMSDEGGTTPVQDELAMQATSQSPAGSQLGRSESLDDLSALTQKAPATEGAGDGSQGLEQQQEQRTTGTVEPVPQVSGSACDVKTDTKPH
jgi:hypothetical protein